MEDDVGPLAKNGVARVLLVIEELRKQRVVNKTLLEAVVEHHFAEVPAILDGEESDFAFH